MPPPPAAPPETAGRALDYPVAYNLVQRPRAYEAVGFAELRGLADAYDLLRLVIETRKDQIEKFDWNIVARRKPGARPSARADDDPRIGALEGFLRRPDREHGWGTWLRMLLEDLLVIDAPTLYKRRDLAGRLHALEVIDGATIKRVIDGHGRTPAPPQPAYQQVLKGLPAVDYAADELIYLPRNPRPGRIYGCSPVEQTMMTVNIALRRQLAQLQYYTEGNVPEALIGVPESWSPDQIRQFQAYWDALLEGNSGARRHAKFVPGAIAKGYVSTREPMLKDEYDEWLARVVCFAFSISPSALTRQMNRATAATVQEAALAEGLAPLLRWVKQLIDRVITEEFGWLDLEFAWLDAPTLSPLEQARIHELHVRSGIKTVDEVRAELGLDPLGPRGAPASDEEDEDEDEDEDGESEETDAAARTQEDDGSEATAKRAATVRTAQFDKAGYDPAQPRVPTGNPDGGEWSGGGEGAGNLLQPINWKQRLIDLFLKPKAPQPGTQQVPRTGSGSTPRPRALEPGKPQPGQTEADVKRAQAELDRIVDGAKRRPDKDSIIFDRPGGRSQAETDFQSLPSVGSVRDVPSGYGPAQVKTLPDGRTATIRGSKEGPRTLEIQPAGEGRDVKIRYPEGQGQ